MPVIGIATLLQKVYVRYAGSVAAAVAGRSGGGERLFCVSPMALELGILSELGQKPILCLYPALTGLDGRVAERCDGAHHGCEYSTYVVSPVVEAHMDEETADGNKLVAFCVCNHPMRHSHLTAFLCFFVGPIFW